MISLIIRIKVDIIKSSAIDCQGWAATLYSVSRLMRLNSSLQAFTAGISRSLQKYRLVFDAAPGRNEAWLTVARAIFAIDGDEELLWKIGKDGRKRETPLWSSILEVAEVAFWDQDGVWLVYTHTREDLVESLARGVP